MNRKERKLSPMFIPPYDQATGLGRAEWHPLRVGRFIVGECYYQLGKRPVGNKLTLCVQLRNVKVKEKFRRQGIFKQVVAELDRIGRHHGATHNLIENLMEPKLVQWLESTGWENDNSSLMEAFPTYVRQL